LVFLLACGSEADGEGTPVSIDDGPSTPAVLTEGPNTSSARRFTVDELQASVSVVAGDDLDGQPIRWLVNVNGTQLDAYDDDAFGTMLGRPDYASTTEEDRAPNTLYVKFARDMARGVCNKIVETDLARPSGQQATLWRHAPGSAPSEAEVTANLTYLMLRFWGTRAGAGDTLLESLRQVYSDAVASYAPTELGNSNAQAEGWRGVCLTLIQDPAFHLH